jgi:hypothetical protein
VAFIPESSSFCASLCLVRAGLGSENKNMQLTAQAIVHPDDPVISSLADFTLEFFGNIPLLIICGHLLSACDEPV